MCKCRSMLTLHMDYSCHISPEKHIEDVYHLTSDTLLHDIVPDHEARSRQDKTAHNKEPLTLDLRHWVQVLFSISSPPGFMVALPARNPQVYRRCPRRAPGYTPQLRLQVKKAPCESE